MPVVEPQKYIIDKTNKLKEVTKQIKFKLFECVVRCKYALKYPNVPNCRVPEFHSW